MRRLVPIAIFAALHFVLSFASLFIGGGFIMAAFDGKGSDLLATAAVVALKVLYFPMEELSGLVSGLRGLGTAGEYTVLAMNSLIWGTAVATVWGWWRRRRHAVAIGA